MKYEWINSYLLSMKGTTKDYKAEWGWTRYLLKNKMFAAVCQDANHRDIITLKLSPMDGEFLRKQYNEIEPGYYMNKLHWNSIDLNGNISDEMMKELLEKSYHLVFSGLSKKLQKEIEE